MPFKGRVEKDELKILRYLNARKELCDQDSKNLYLWQKGYEGECKFDLLTNELPEKKFLVINDLLLESNNTKFQIDSNIFAQGTFNLFEVKNFEGDYDYDAKENKFYYLSFGKRKEILNPLEQTKRCETLFRQLLQSNQINFPVKSWLIFIHPEFYLHHAPENPSIIYPTQINRFMNKFSDTRAVLTEKHFEIAGKLVSLHQEESPYSRMAPYHCDELKKGPLCKDCYTFMGFDDKGHRVLVCKRCGCCEKVEIVVIRSVRELQLLFPGMKITTNVVFDWLGGVVSKRAIQRVLPSSFKMLKSGQTIYYI